MQYTTIVEKSEDGILLILEKAQNFDRESVLDGIDKMHYTTSEIKHIVLDVQESHVNLRRELNSIIQFAKDFNRQFATVNNKCFDTAERLFGKIRSSVSGSKKIYKQFCIKMNRRSPGIDSSKKASVFSYSIIANGSYNYDLFGEEYYPRVVRELCDELESFFKDLVLIMKICHDVNAEEKRIHDDPKRLLVLYKNDYAVIKEMQKEIVSFWRKQNIAINIDPLTKQMKTHTLQTFLRDNFHKHSRAILVMHVVNKELEEGLRDGLSEEEALMWSDHHDIVTQVRLIIEHFDELEPRGSKDNKQGKYRLSGAVMARFVKWCYLENSKFEAPFIEKYFPNLYHGEYLTVKANTVNTAKNKFTKAGGDPEYADFQKRVEALIAKYMTAAPKTLSLAANY